MNVGSASRGPPPNLCVCMRNVAERRSGNETGPVQRTLTATSWFSDDELSKANNTEAASWRVDDQAVRLADPEPVIEEQGRHVGQRAGRRAQRRSQLTRRSRDPIHGPIRRTSDAHSVLRAMLAGFGAFREPRPGTSLRVQRHSSAVSPRSSRDLLQRRCLCACASRVIGERGGGSLAPSGPVEREWETMRTPKRRAGGKTRARVSKKGRVQRKPLRNPAVPHDSAVVGLGNRIEPLLRSLVALRAQALALGVFAEDRALLECPKCGLGEDVLSDGRLVTYRSVAVMDTGLRFIEASDGCFTCPSCGTEILLNEPR